MTSRTVESRTQLRIRITVFVNTSHDSLQPPLLSQLKVELNLLTARRLKHRRTPNSYLMEEFGLVYYTLVVPLSLPVILLLLYMRWLGWELYTNN
ncbi:putative Phosphatidylinositol N-acetylglucosaminyltransferase subunit Y-containing protein [Homarus americanus]|uniref:Putative Phosphatidylinositol N-acetylglucosaminyltransferase subunit Y-containing protein n=1 Tax=Homarus americanus TaxID=6706 RepID=A0A8J5N542_HOMAM|nr:putative Phosphatidylinositol N-acetylglucosaminyltransferase subunit Y-containing protein [Homarus americanus]